MLVQHPHGTTHHFNTDEQFISWVQIMWDENEIDNEANLERPDDVYTAMIYLINYTEFQVVSIQP